MPHPFPRPAPGTLSLFLLSSSARPQLFPSHDGDHLHAVVAGDRLESVEIDIGRHPDMGHIGNGDAAQEIACCPGPDGPGRFSRPPDGQDKKNPRVRGKVFGTKGASRPQLQRIRPTIIDKLPRSNMVIPGGLQLRMIDTAAFKELIHSRLERGMEAILNARGTPIGEKPQSQRFYLHADTGQDYASQLLAEELWKDRRGKKYWKRVRTANHLLDAECLAAACADSSWLPSLKMLAAWTKSQEKQAVSPDAKHFEPKAARSNWMNR